MKRLFVMCITIFCILLLVSSVIGCTEKKELLTITEPPELTKSIVTGKAPFFLGEGDTNLTCGKCDTILAKNIVNGQIRNIVFKCPTCGECCEQHDTPPVPTNIPGITEIMPGYYDFSIPFHLSREDVIVGVAK